MVLTLILTVFLALIPYNLVSPQYQQTQYFLAHVPYHYTGPYGGGQYSPQEKFPTNSTPLFRHETPYKKVNTNKDVADMFVNGIESREKEDVFDLLSSGLVLNTVAGTATTANSITWPHIKGMGLAIAYVKAPPCAAGIPHYHLNSDEMNFVSTGNNVTVGIKAPNKPLNLIKNVELGQVVVIPRGHLHFFINLHCTQVAEAVQMFNADSIGNTMPLGPDAMALPHEMLHVAFNAEIDHFEELDKTKPEEQEFLRLNQYCLKRCGLI